MNSRPVKNCTPFMRLALSSGALLVISALLAACGGSGGDTLQFTNGGTGDNGALVDGLKDGSHVNDASFTGAAGATISLGDIDSSPQSNEIIAYTNEHPPTLKESLGWTSGTDAIALAFESKYRVPFYIWIVEGPFDSQRVKAIDACIKTAQIWSDERQGVGFNIFEINDVTGDADASTFADFTCGLASSMKSQIGFNSSGINVYYVDTVDFGSGPGTTNGVWCGNNLVAMGKNTSDHLFSHEIGHGFAIAHTNTLTSFFDTTNVMHNASNNRNYLTEGQTFRAVVNSSSAINATYNARPGLTTRSCGNITSTTDIACPAVQKRIWDDGPGWPPN